MKNQLKECCDEIESIHHLICTQVGPDDLEKLPKQTLEQLKELSERLNYLLN